MIDAGPTGTVVAAIEVVGVVVTALTVVDGTGVVVGTAVVDGTGVVVGTAVVDRAIDVDVDDEVEVGLGAEVSTTVVTAEVTELTEVTEVVVMSMLVAGPVGAEVSSSLHAPVTTTSASAATQDRDRMRRASTRQFCGHRGSPS